MNTTWKRITLAAYIATVGALVAFTLVTHQNNPQDSPVANPDPGNGILIADTHHYQSVGTLYDAVTRLNIPCTNAQIVDEPTNGARSMWVCDTLSLSVYDTHNQAQAGAIHLAGAAQGLIDIRVVVGDNWTVNCPTPDTCQTIAVALDGKVMHAPPAVGGS